MTRRIKQDLGIISFLAVASLATRIPYRGRYLYNWDSVNYALGLERFSVPEHQPHPPGYILYIGAGRVFNFFLNNPNNALIALSIISSVIAVVGLYLIANSFFDRTTGLIASILVLFSPLAWFYGEVALSYMVELPLVLASTWLLYQLLFHKRYAIVSAIFLGIAAGFRQDVLLFLGPFWLVGSLRVGVRTMLASWLAIVVSILVWLTPLVYLVGGISAYRELTSVQFQTAVYLTSYFASGSDGGVLGLFRNAKEVWRAMLWLLGSASILYLFLAGLFLLPNRLINDRRLLFLILLLLTPLLFFIFFHFGQPGYLLVYSAPLFMLVSRALIIVAKDFNRAFTRNPSDVGISHGIREILTTPYGIVLIVFMSLTVLANTGLFIRAGRINTPFPTADGTISDLFGIYSAGGIGETDRQTESILATVKQFSPETTIVGSIYVAPSPYPYAPDWRRLMYYLPNYRVLMLRVDSGDGYLEARNHLENISDDVQVTVDNEVTRALFIGVKPKTSVDLATLKDTPGNAMITAAEIPPGGWIGIGPFYFGNSPKPEF